MLLRLIRQITRRRPGAAGVVTLAQVQDAIKAGDLDKARKLCENILASQPDNLDALHLAGAIFHQQGDTARAIAFLTRAAESETDPQPSLGLGQIFKDAGRFAEAISCFERAVEIDPGAYDGRIALAGALIQNGKLDAAEPHLRQAMALKPDSYEPYRMLAPVFFVQDRPAEVAEVVRQMQRIEPFDGSKILLALLMPAMYQSTQEIEQTRHDLARRVDELLDGPPLTVSDPVAEIGITAFNLAYHALNNCELQRRIVRLCRKAYQPKHGSLATPRRRGRRIRVGFASGHMNFHSVGRVNHGLISRLDRDRFEVTVFSLARHHDALAREIRAASDHYVEFDGNSLAQIEQTVAQHEMDVLLYTDVGMDPLSYFLAYSRLAPLQLVGWGHPDTTGIDTLDYYVSADVVEVPEAQSHYTEKLARLPAWIIPGYRRPPRPTVLKPRTAFGLSDHTNLYACPQAPYKIHPDFDQAIAAILREDPRGEVVFVAARHPRLCEQLRQRFEHTIADVAARIRFLPDQPWMDYLNLIAISDVMLDPFHFGGGNTTYESLAMGTPVVTLPSRFLRGRPALGCYVKIGITECIAETPQQYVKIALRLGTDRDFRNFVSQQIAQRCEVLFENYEMVDAFGNFIEKTYASLP